MSEATRGALAGILSQFPPMQAAAATDSLPAPWQLTMPRDTVGVDWLAIRRTVMRLLNARPRRMTDQRWRDLTIGNVRMSPDSVAFTFSIGGAQRCGDGAVGSSATYGVAFPRATVPWTPQVVPLRFSDGFGCDSPAVVEAPPRAVPVPPVSPTLRVVRPSPVLRDLGGRAREP